MKKKTRKLKFKPKGPIGHSGYLQRVERLERMIQDGALLADNLSPDFWVDDEEPGFHQRIGVESKLRNAKKEIAELKEIYQRVIG